jgi:hypothetical protein
VSLDLDASATLGLTLNGKADVSVSTPKRSLAPNDRNVDADLGLDLSEEMNNIFDHEELAATGANTVSPDSSLERNIDESSPTKRAVEKSASVDGCVDMQAGFSVNAGAQGSFFGLFDPSTKITLFNKQFELFKKCFGAATPKRSIDPMANVPPVAFNKRALQCSGSITNNLASLVDQLISGANIKAL